MGRRSKLTPETQEKILEGIRLGLTYERAAQAAGIDVSTFYNWRNRGESASSGKYFDFFHELKRAEIEGERECLQIIRDAAPKSWQAAAWLLERRFPNTYGRRIRQDIYDVRQPVIELISAGKVTFEQVEEEFGGDLARELFAGAGVVVAEGGQAAEQGEDTSQTISE